MSNKLRIVAQLSCNLDQKSCIPAQQCDVDVYKTGKKESLPSPESKLNLKNAENLKVPPGILNFVFFHVDKF